MKVGFLITASLKSKRLPFKVLKELKGKSVIERIIDRAKEIDGISDIVLCTTTNHRDKPLIDIAIKKGIYYFTGSEEDVLYRFLIASKLFQMDYFINITADNPLFSIYHAGLMLKEIKKNKYDYLKMDGLPFGSFCYGLRVKALEVVCKIKQFTDTEIWGYFFNQPRIFNTHTMIVEDKYRRPDIRLTLDYQEDYEFLKYLHKTINFKKILKLEKVIDFLVKNPRILQINSHCYQRDLDSKTKNKIDRFYMENYKDILKIKERIYGN